MFFADPYQKKAGIDGFLNPNRALPFLFEINSMAIVGNRSHQVECGVLVFLLLLIFLSSTAVGQSRVDSLTSRLATARGNTRVDVLNQLAFEFIGYDAAKASEYCAQAISLARTLRYQDGRATALVYRGVNAYLTGAFDPSREDLREGLALARQTKNRNLEGYAYLQMGNSYMNQTVLDSSMHYYQLSYDILKDSTNPLNLSKLYRNLGTLYGLRSDVDMQVAYIKKALRIRELLGNKQLVADALVELGRLNARHSNFEAAKQFIAMADSVIALNPTDEENLNDLAHVRALCLLNEGKSEEAFPLLDSALTFYIKTGLILKNLILYMDLGTIFSNRGEYELALKNYNAALRITELRPFVVEKLDLHVRLGWVYFHLGEYARAEEFATQALEETRKQKLIGRVSNALTLLGVTFTELKQYEKAHAVLAEAMKLRQTEDPTQISEGYLNMAYLYEREEKFAEAVSHYQASLKHAEVTDSRLVMAWCYLGLGNIAVRQERYEESARWLGKAESYAAPLNANEVLIRSYNARREMLKAQGKFRESLHYAERVDQMKDSLHRGDQARRFANLQKINEIEKRDQDIRALERERVLAKEKIQIQEASLRQYYVLNAVSVAAIVLLAGIAIVYARFFSKVKRLNKTIQENNLNIQAQAHELSVSYDQIRELNGNLQALVDEKTRDLIFANEELQKQNGELQQFSYSVSHNLRGPVARIMGLATLARNASQATETSQFNELIHKSSQDLDQVLRDLSKIIDVRNEFYRAKEMVDLREEWRKCVDLLKDSIPADTDFHVAFDSPSAFTIRAVMQSLFHNLLTNAIKYRDPERELKVSLRTFEKEQATMIVFEDNGLGIDMERHGGSIFKLFRRFHTHVEGRGIGLYLIRSQIESLNGTIRPHSEVGKGTRFEIVLPLTITVAEEAIANYSGSV